MAGEIDLKDLDFQSLDLNFEFEDDNINFPLPETEVVENPNMEQNTGLLVFLVRCKRGAGRPPFI